MASSSKESDNARLVRERRASAAAGLTTPPHPSLLEYSPTRHVTPTRLLPMRKLQRIIERSEDDSADPAVIDAHFAMGYHYEHGVDGVPRDLKSAHVSYETAALAGHAQVPTTTTTTTTTTKTSTNNTNNTK